MRTINAGPFSLEPQVAGHAGGLFALLSDPEIYRFVDDGPPASLMALEERYARLETRKSPDGQTLWLNWVIRLASGKLAGYVQATVSPDHEALIGYVVGTAFWRQGIGRPAVAAMLTELDQHYGVTRVLASVDRHNLASIALLTGLGFGIGHSGVGIDMLFEKHLGLVSAMS